MRGRSPFGAAAASGGSCSGGGTAPAQSRWIPCRLHRPPVLLTSCPQMLEGFSTSTIAAGALQSPVASSAPSLAVTRTV